MASVGLSLDVGAPVSRELVAPVIALGKNEDAEKFWRKQPGWEVHPREVQ